MYENFFNLKRNPFLMTADPHFLYLTAAHREALAGLMFAILNRKGLCALIGEVGTGKTTLLQTTLGSVPETLARFSVILNPALTPAEFLEMVLLGFGLDEVPQSKARRLLLLEQFLTAADAEGKTAVLIVDEAHRLPPDVLEEVRLLTNIERVENKLLQIVLAGQTEIEALLDQRELRQIKQRIAYRFRVEPMSHLDVGAYVRHRWIKAGGAHELPFHEDALDYLGPFSGGIPRVINAICDNALMLAFSEGNPLVGPEHIVIAAKELRLYDGGAVSNGPASAGMSAPCDGAARAAGCA